MRDSVNRPFVKSELSGMVESAPYRVRIAIFGVVFRKKRGERVLVG